MINKENIKRIQKLKEIREKRRSENTRISVGKGGMKENNGEKEGTIEEEENVII